MVSPAVSILLLPVVPPNARPSVIAYPISKRVKQIAMAAIEHDRPLGHERGRGNEGRGGDRARECGPCLWRQGGVRRRVAEPRARLVPFPHRPLGRGQDHAARPLPWRAGADGGAGAALRAGPARDDARRYSKAAAARRRGPSGLPVSRPSRHGRQYCPADRGLRARSAGRGGQSARPDRLGRAARAGDGAPAGALGRRAAARGAGAGGDPVARPGAGRRAHGKYRSRDVRAAHAAPDRSQPHGHGNLCRDP